MYYLRYRLRRVIVYKSQKRTYNCRKTSVDPTGLELILWTITETEFNGRACSSAEYGVQPLCW
jgi:hypothetical protein